MKQRVRELQDQSDIELNNESKEARLVGEVISTVALAGQLCREFNVSDHGIDMEIEFNDDAGEATGRKVYLQLKSGDSHLRERKSDGAEIFTDQGRARRPLLDGTAIPGAAGHPQFRGQVRWMEVRQWLRSESDHGKKPVKQIVFDGQRFDVMSVRRWRRDGVGPGFRVGIPRAILSPSRWIRTTHEDFSTTPSTVAWTAAILLLIPSLPAWGQAGTGRLPIRPPLVRAGRATIAAVPDRVRPRGR